MSITFKKTIIHNLDLSIGIPVLSKECVALNDETESFITRKIIGVIENSGSCEAIFKEQMSLFPEDEPLTIFKNWKDESLKRIAEIFANAFYRYMQEYGNIPSGDLIVTNYLMDGEEYVAVLKVNFTKGDFAHVYNGDEETVRLVINKGIYEKKLSEALIIKLSDASALLLDGSKSKYLALLFELDTKMSIKEKLKAVDKIAANVIDEHYYNPVKAVAQLKNNITEQIARTNSLNVVKVMEDTFGEDEEVFESCKEHLEEFGLNNEKPIEVKGSKMFKKYSTQKLKTDTGIEVKMPTHIFNDSDFVEIINEPNGTISIVIKNVNQIENK